MKKNTLVAYNKDVLNALEKKDWKAGNLLNANGSALGLWDTIRYWFTQGVSVETACERLVEMITPLTKVAKETDK